MGFILIDTCVWINLASTPALLPLVDELERHAVGPPHSVVVPESVKIEFARNQPKIAQMWQASFKGQVSGIKNLKALIPEHKAAIDVLISASNAALKEGEAKVISAEKRVLELLEKAEAHSHIASEYEEACKRGLEHRAPASTPKRSSVGDCLLWLSALRLLDDHCVWFCTENHHDFSPDKFDELHSDLKAETASKKHKLYFFNDPSKLIDHLNSLEKRVPAPALPQYSDYFPPVPPKCPGCGGEIRDGGYSPSPFGWTWKKRCVGCGFVWDTGEFMDD